MAKLFPEVEETHKDWCRWAIEFVKRGLWPKGEIEVHGPHPYPADCLWGEAECDYLERSGKEIYFQTRRSCRGSRDVRNVVMRDKNDRSGKGYFPILRLDELPQEYREKLKSLKGN